MSSSGVAAETKKKTKTKPLPRQAIRTEAAEVTPPDNTEPSASAASATTAAEDPHNRQRKQVSMRLASQIEGYETTRTTNFSRDTYENIGGSTRFVDPRENFGLDAFGLYSLLRSASEVPSGRESDQAGSGENAESSSSSPPPYEEIAKAFYEQHITSSAAGAGEDSTADSTEEDQQRRQQHEKLLQNALRYARLPVLLRDADDGGFVGAFPDSQETADLVKMKLVQKVPEDEAVLVLEDLAERMAEQQRQQQEK